MLDAVAGCIAMLSEELQAHLEDRKRVAEALEDRVRARTAELGASMERYRTLVESTHAVPWEANASTLEVTYIAPQAEGLLGTPVAALVGSNTLWSLVHPDDRERVSEEISGLSHRGRQQADLEYRLVRPDQRVIYVRSIVAAHAAAVGQISVLRGITFDVTQQKKLESELRQAQKLESVGRLASGIAHEINTPIQFVSDSVTFVRDGMKDVALAIGGLRAVREAVLRAEPSTALATQTRALEESTDLDYLLENVPGALERALEGLERVAVIVRSMKEFAHPSPKEMCPIDLNRAIATTLVIARNEYKYVADVETSFGDIPPLTCHAGDLNQALLNIIINAGHAIGDVARGDEKGLISIRTFRDGDSIVVAIRDTGPGIPERIRDRIFDPFFTTKEVGRGTGQGLAIARAVVEERHGGQLRFETELGKGTTFFLRLPIENKRRSSSRPQVPQEVLGA
jgi:PAS domain S-box-containing protein